MPRPLFSTFVQVAAAGLPLVAWSAEAPRSNAPGPCARTSVLEEIDNRDPQLLRSILARAANVENSGFVLWRIERDGAAPSHLFATIHVIDTYLQKLTPAVQSAIAASQTAALESAEIDRQSLHRLAALASELMVAGDDQSTLGLGPALQAKLEHELEIAGLPAYWAVTMRPWALTLLLGRSDCQERRMRSGMLSLDMLVAGEAKARGVPLIGLETHVEQYQSLASLPDDVQIAWLKSTIALAGREDEIAETIGELYRFRRISALWELSNGLLPDAGLDTGALLKLQTRLIDLRNQRMFERSRPLLMRGGAFIAVGALHLVGPHGLVELLRSDGFKMTPIE